FLVHKDTVIDIPIELANWMADSRSDEVHIFLIPSDGRILCSQLLNHIAVKRESQNRIPFKVPHQILGFYAEFMTPEFEFTNIGLNTPETRRQWNIHRVQ